MSKQQRLGLVLSGGGARGAYQVGVVKALAGLGIEPDVVSGTSIGAINGAVVAAASDMGQAAQQLECLWVGLDPADILKPGHFPEHYLSLFALHLVLRSAAVSQPLALVVSTIIGQVHKRLSEDNQQFLHMLDSSPIESILKKAINVQTLRSGRPLHVGVFPATDSISLSGMSELVDLWRFFQSRDRSEFLCVQDYEDDQVPNLLLASAALPLAFKPIQIGDRYYRDGGMGDHLRCQGNTPIEPLIKSGCRYAIVVMGGDAALWNRYEWPEITVLEIRPSIRLDEGSWLKSLLNFDPIRIQELIRQGEEDARRSLGKVFQTLLTVVSARQAYAELDRLLKITNS